MSTAAALLDLTLDTVAEFVEPAPFLWAKAALDIVEEGWDRGEEALEDYLLQQYAAMRAELVQKYQKKLSERIAEFNARVEEIQREADAAIASREADASAKVKQLNLQLLEVIEVAEKRIAALQAEIDRLTAELDESRK